MLWLWLEIQGGTRCWHLVKGCAGVSCRWLIMSRITELLELFLESQLLARIPGLGIHRDTYSHANRQTNGQANANK